MEENSEEDDQAEEDEIQMNEQECEESNNRFTHLYNSGPRLNNQ